MDSSSTYYAVGLISLIVATLLFIMYINVINMDLATDEKEGDRSQDSSVQYVTMDDSFYRNKGHNGKHRRRDDKRDYDWDYDERHAREMLEQERENNKNHGGGHFKKQPILGKDGHGQQKFDTTTEGFLPAANDLTVKQKLQTGAENIRNTLK